MLFSYSKSKARCVNELWSVMLPGRDGRTTNAEHQQQQRRHIHVVYGPPRDRYARLAMPAMLGASATDRRWLLISISSCDSGGPGDGMFASLALPHLLTPGFLHLTWVRIGLGWLFFAYSIHWKVQNMLNYSLQYHYQFVVLPHRKSNLHNSEVEGIGRQPPIVIR